YTATDGSGQEGTAVRYVIVQDTELPVITLVDNDTVMVEVFTFYTDPGADITDNYCTDGNYSVDNYPDMNKIGNYTINYSAEDCEGNKAVTVTRVVKVVDRTAPLIELIGDAAENLVRWSTYADPGVTLSDNYYKVTDLTPLLETTSNLDLNYPGVYSTCYQVTDPSGNVSNTACRTLNFIEQTNGISDALASKVSVYPNPNYGLFTGAMEGSFGNNATISITDITGKVIQTMNASGLEK